MFTKAPATAAYIAQLPRSEFMEVHRDKVGQTPRAFDALMQSIVQLVSLYESRPPMRAAQALPQFQRYLTVDVRRRRRF